MDQMKCASEINLATECPGLFLRRWAILRNSERQDFLSVREK